LPATIFYKGKKILALKSQLQLDHQGATILSTTVDPEVTAIDANEGDFIISTFTKKTYVKQSDGQNTDVTQHITNAAAGGITTEVRTLDNTDITNKYIILTEAPTTKTLTRTVPIDGIEQEYGVDFEVTTDDSDKRLSWNGLGLESLLASGDKLIITYN
jgi:hypothetical protein